MRPGTMKKIEARKGALGQMSNPINPFQKADSVLSIDREILMQRIEQLEKSHLSLEENLNQKFQKYTKNLNILVKKQIQPEIAT